jgi:hypothetical protein
MTANDKRIKHLQAALQAVEAWRDSLFETDADGDSYCTDIKTERKLRSIRDRLKAML